MNPLQKAKNILSFYCIRSPSRLNLEEIANAEGLIVDEKPLNSHLGRITYGVGHGLITISSNIENPGAKRFTLAHEMGHFFNEGSRLKNKFGCTPADLLSFKSKKRYEDEANEFAAELLMHKPWFSDFIRNRPVSLDLIKETAAYFNVSLTAAAVRYAEIGQFPIAVIMTQAGKIKWCVTNDYFPVRFVKKNSPVQKYTRVYDYYRGKEIDTGEDLVLCETWFKTDYNCRKDLYFYEDNLPMPNYNSVLTILRQYEY